MTYSHNLYRESRGPILDDDGNPEPIFWVECVGCGHEYPLTKGPDGKVYVPVMLNRLAPVGEDGRVCGEIYYASKGCTPQAAHLIRDEYGDEAVRVVVIPPLQPRRLTVNVSPQLSDRSTTST